MLKIILLLFLLSGFVPACHAQTAIPQEVKENIKLRVVNGINPGIVVGIIDADGTHY
jgi:hypothetical protein